jgi:hypothetical protein
LAEKEVQKFPFTQTDRRLSALGFTFYFRVTTFAFSIENEWKG